MIHHVSVGTNDLARARAFYDPVLTLLGYRLVSEDEVSIDYGIAHIVFSVETPVDGARATPGNGVHVAFEALDRAMVDRFHAIALANGGTDDGPPGGRPQYDENYYSAFVRDPDGNKIEAVTHSAR
jgi:catechol 2,3-dioxygenase-like lactoylglutathione lyase family enzyme